MHASTKKVYPPDVVFVPHVNPLTNVSVQVLNVKNVHHPQKTKHG